MKEKKVTFKCIYIIYLGVLAGLVIAALMYVNSVLADYEASLPEKQVEEAIATLVADAKADHFWEKYELTQVECGRLESDFDMQDRYQNQFLTGDLEYSEKAGTMEEDKAVYSITGGGVKLADVTLRATSPMMTKLAILNYRTWEIESIEPIFEGQGYSLTVPADFVVIINGVQLGEQEITSATEKETTYETGTLYFAPDVEITDKDGNPVSHQISQGKINAEFYYYTLYLPSVLTVELNGSPLTGQQTDGDRICYEIRELQKPQVCITDYYGNQFLYEGGNEIPLTYMTIAVDSRYKVLVMDRQAPMDVVTVKDNPEYEVLADYVTDLPQVHTYEIAVLSKDAKVQVVNQDNIAVEMDEGKTSYDFVKQAGNVGDVPTAVATQVDVLAIAQEWSLFMSNDRSFDDIKGYMVKDSYQYRVTKKYASSVDRRFFSSHYLLDPAFTDETVSNFTWITDDCFAVDISFVKHMVLKRTGKNVDDAMHDRFYFIKWDDTKDGVDNPTWKIVSMKEIVSHAE